MTTFQTVTLPLLGVLALLTAIAIARHTINPRAGFAWLLLWLAAAGAIARPSITSSIAHMLGIGRGADLVLYCAIVAMLIGFFYMYLRFKRLDREITRLVRHVAIDEAERETR